jgi:hypothetical protein
MPSVVVYVSHGKRVSRVTAYATLALACGAAGAVNAAKRRGHALVVCADASTVAGRAELSDADPRIGAYFAMNRFMSDVWSGVWRAAR